MTKEYDVHYDDGRTSLVLEADLDRGWRKLRKTYGFHRQLKIPYRNDLSIRAQLTLIAQPATFHESARCFPDVKFELGDQSLSFRLQERHLTVKVALSLDQPWRIMSSGRPGLYIEELPLLSVDPTHWCDLRALIVFHQGSSRPIPDVRVWVENKLVVPGGQFESNRRRF